MERENYFSYKLTYVNWACAVSVVLLHVINNSPKYRAECSLLNVLLDGMSNMANLAVPMFFAISGFLFFLNFDNTFESLIRKYKKRIKSLVIPYLFWNAMIWIMLALIYKIPDAGQDRVLFGIQDFLRVVINADYSPMWFVKTLIVYMIIAPIIVLTWRNKWIPWVWIGGFNILTFLGVNTRFIPILYLPMYLGGGIGCKALFSKASESQL